MGVFSALGPTLTAATQVGGDIASANVKASQMKLQEAVMAANMKREQQLADIKQAVANSEVPLNKAKTAEATRNASAPVQYSPEAIAGAGAEAGAVANAKLPADLQLAVANHTMSMQEAVTIQGMRSKTEQGIATQRVGAEATQGDLNRQATAANTQATIKGGMNRVKQTQAGSLTGRILGVPGGDAPPPSQQQQDWDKAAEHAKSIGQDPAAVLPPRPEN